MAKLWILTVFAVAALAQVSLAADLGEALNMNIREQLRLYDIFAKDPEAAKYSEDLKKLIQITEGALKTESVQEKEQTINTIDKNFNEEFNKWVGAKLEHAQVNDDIHAAITFYSGLLQKATPHEEEIKKTLSTLENLLKETNLKEKEDKFLGLTKTFSPEFEKFLKESSLPEVNQTLKKTAAFFATLLEQKEGKYEKEIADLKAKTEAALADSVSIDEKNKVLSEVSLTADKDLNDYLAKKNIELA
ncbi:uncharacterized protein LOC106080487 [Stomoxys calcitrans]|uniref:Uncharacterized protein n=1 Tax=Stomoxys calcitrans TaxID=35570 RepID=A0A1I8NPP2_STOCA|nr:uncharacterized protein LOC106080487 [Stomoxys calcitrans]